MLQRIGYSIATALVAGAAAGCAGLFLLDGPCSFNMTLISAYYILLFSMALPLIIPATIGGVTGYAFGWRALLISVAILAVTSSALGIREALPHTVIPDGASGCRAPDF